MYVAVNGSANIAVQSSSRSRFKPSAPTQSGSWVMAASFEGEPISGFPADFAGILVPAAFREALSVSYTNCFVSTVQHLSQF
jgi:hypothetical protein